MAGPAAVNGDEEKPLDPMVENVRRKMMRLMIVSIGIMMIGLMAVLGAIVYKYNTGGTSSAEIDAAATQEPGQNPVPVLNQNTRMLASGNIALPKGAVIETSSLAGSRILLKVKNSDGSIHLMVFDTGTASIIADFSVLNSSQ